MGSYIELNDTLQITTEQGFPSDFRFDDHLQNPYTADAFKNKIYEFHDKPNVRIFHSPPVRVFWAHNIEGKWLYWGLIEIIELNLNLINKSTSGKYRIIKIFSPEEMKQAETILSTNSEIKYFK